MAPESTATVLGALAGIARDGRARDIDLVLRRPDGQTRVVTLDATRITDTAGTLLGAQAVVRDVTVERQLAGALEQQRRTLHVIFDSIPAACILFEADATIAAANPPVEHVSATTAAEMVGRNAAEVCGTPGPEGSPVARASQSGRIEQQVSWVENKKGERVYVHRTAGPVMSGGKVARVVEILVDVSEQIHRGDLRVLQFWRGQAPGSLALLRHFAFSGDPTCPEGSVKITKSAISPNVIAAACEPPRLAETAPCNAETMLNESI